MKEVVIRTACLRYMNSLPRAFFWTSPPNSPTGLPDICGVLDGKPVYVETKTDHGRVSKAQKYVHRKLQEAGALVIVARSVAEIKAIWPQGGNE